MHLIESLEPRRLFTAPGLTANGAATTIASLTGRASAAACAVGNNDTFVAYVKSNTVKAVIVDPAGTILVPEFTLSTGGQSANPFSAMTAATDSNGNAVLVYPVGTSNRNLYIARINSAGTVIDAPILVTSVASHDQSAPALAAGPNGQVGLVYLNAPGIGSSLGQSIFTRIFDTTDTPLFTETQVSNDPPTPSSFELLSHPSIIFNPLTNAYVTAWDLQDLSPSFANLREAVDGSSFSPTASPNPTAVWEVASSTTDTFGVPLFNPTPTGTDLFVGHNAFDPSPSFNFNGSAVERIHLNFSNVPEGLTLHVPISITAPAEILPTQLLPGTDPTLLCNNGTYNGSGISSSGFCAITLAPDGTVLANNTPVLPASQFFDPVVLPAGTDAFTGMSFVYNPNNNSTTISAYPLAFTAPAVTTVTMSITNVTRSADGTTPPQMIVTATLSAVADADVTVHIMDYIPGNANLSSHPFNFNVSNTITIHKGDLSGTFPVDIFSYQPGGTLNGDVVIQADFSSAGQIVNPVVTGTVTTTANTANVHGTATPGHPFVATDPDGYQALISTTDGTVTVSTLPDGNLKITTTKTNGKTKVKIIKNPLGGKSDRAALAAADTRFNIEQLILSSPIDTLDAATTDITGTLTLKGFSSLTLGNLTATHPISLGTLNNATLKFGALTSAALTSTGSIKSLSVTDWTGGSLTAGTIATLTSTGDLDANLTVTSLSTLSVTGILGGTSASDVRTLRAAKSFGTITASALNNASLLAGLKSTAHTLPTKRSSFSNTTSSIASFSLKGSAPSFTNAIIAAPLLGKVTITGLLSTNPTPFGITAEKITAYTRGSIKAKNTFSPKLIDAADQYAVRTI